MGKKNKSKKKGKRVHPYARNSMDMDTDDGAKGPVEDTRGKILQRHKLEYKVHRSKIEDLKRKRLKIKKTLKDERKEMQILIKKTVEDFEERQKDELKQFDEAQAKKKEAEKKAAEFKFNLPVLPVQSCVS